MKVFHRTIYHTISYYRVRPVNNINKYVLYYIHYYHYYLLGIRRLSFKWFCEQKNILNSENSFFFLTHITCWLLIHSVWKLISFVFDEHQRKSNVVCIMQLTFWRIWIHFIKFRSPQMFNEFLQYAILWEPIVFS